MKSRSSIYALGAGTRRGLVLLWTALLLSSMLLQYVAAAAPVLAVHDDGLFELDGNAIDGAAPATTGTPPTTRGARCSSAVRRRTPSHGSDVLHRRWLEGRPRHLSEWDYASNDVRPTRTTSSHAFAAAYSKDGQTFVYFGADRFATMAPVTRSSASGSSRATASPWTATAGSTRVHKNGDLLVVIHFTNGGVDLSTIELYEWLEPASLTAQSTSSRPPDLHRPRQSDDACAVVNAARRDGALAVPGQGRQVSDDVPGQARSTRAASTSTPGLRRRRPLLLRASSSRPVRPSPRPREPQGLRARQLQHLQAPDDRPPSPASPAWTSAAPSPTPRR